MNRHSLASLPFSGPVLASHLLIGGGVVMVLSCHLLSGVYAGMLAYLLIQCGTPLVERRVGSARGRLVMTGALAVVVVALLSGLVLWITSRLHGQGGMDALWDKIAQTIDGASGQLPAWVLDKLPNTAEEVKAEVVQSLREHAAELRILGKEAGLVLAHVLIGLIIGAMVAVQGSEAGASRGPLAVALRQRIACFYQSFRSVFGAQGKISLINAGFTAVYLLALLPLLGIHLPFSKTMVLITALVGLLPVVGNLISNTIIVLVALSVSMEAALLSLGFLVILHKLEYFLNARIVGAEIHARAWELLLAMVVMETLFGVGGVALAPVLYCHIKQELKGRGLI
ncbi:MAG: AI-2E family transporter [Zoogloea sp.]|uniref:AI-2E family transporter n=1 Tax=Zoogloea sp. TaxID=49181 RepID=UPI003F3FCA88